MQSAGTAVHGHAVAYLAIIRELFFESSHFLPEHKLRGLEDSGDCRQDLLTDRGVLLFQSDKGNLHKQSASFQTAAASEAAVTTGSSRPFPFIERVAASNTLTMRKPQWPSVSGTRPLRMQSPEVLDDIAERFGTVNLRCVHVAETVAYEQLVSRFLRV